MMKISVNGTATEIPDSLTIAGLLEARAIKPGQAVVQCNGDIITVENFAAVVLKENDEVEILRFVGGG